MDYQKYLEVPDDSEVLWQGIVKIDQSFVKRLSNPSQHEDLNVYTIRDSRYSKEDNAQFDNSGLLRNFPNELTVIIKGSELMEFMKCSVFKGYEYQELTKGFLIKFRTEKKTVVKGFILEPLSDTVVEDFACLGVIQFDNEESGNEAVYKLDTTELRPSLILHKLKMVALASGSQGSNITFTKDPQKSVTIVFVASNKNPFIADLDSKNGMQRITCGSNGLKTQEIREVYPSQHSTPSDTSPKVKQSSRENDDALQILKDRLAKGEITIYEYENLRNIIEGNRNSASTNWWA